MYNVVKLVIESRNYELKDMLTKIDTFWTQGIINIEERMELIDLAQKNANPDNSYAPLQQQINVLFDSVSELNQKVLSLSNRIQTLEGNEADPVPEPDEYPVWEAWNGIGPNPWQNGSKCSHNEMRWVSQVDNNIWEPGAEGVHETIWMEVTEEVKDMTEEAQPKEELGFLGEE